MGINSITMKAVDEAYNAKDYKALYRMAYDNPMAVYYLKDDAEHGVLDAMHWYAMIFDDGYGVEENIEHAFDLMQESAKCGHPESARELGRMYCAEVYGVQDYDAARYWFKRAVQLGDKEAEGWLKTIEERLAIINGESL